MYLHKVGKTERSDLGQTILSLDLLGKRLRGLLAGGVLVKVGRDGHLELRLGADVEEEEVMVKGWLKDTELSKCGRPSLRWRSATRGGGQPCIG